MHLASRLNFSRPVLSDMISCTDSPQPRSKCGKHQVQPECQDVQHCLQAMQRLVSILAVFALQPFFCGLPLTLSWVYGLYEC